MPAGYNHLPEDGRDDGSKEPGGGGQKQELPGAAHCRHQGAQEPCTGVLDVW
jgi:hypothetical protein